MRPLYDFHIKVEKNFEDEFKVGSLTLAKDMRFDDFEGRISYAEIVAVPEKFGTAAEIGDLLVFHHHINQEPDKYFIGGGVARVSYDPTNYQGQSYAAISPSGEVKMLGNWVFLEAVSQKQEEYGSKSGLFLGHKSEEDKQEARVYCEGLGTEELDLKKGDLVGYSKNSDYLIKLPNGDKVYRMKPDDIIYKAEEKVDHFDYFDKHPNAVKKAK
jgi:co-chaperonin GroES (HSP10)